MTIDPLEIQFQGGAGHGRYSFAFPDGSEAEMDYVERGPGVVVITHTETPPQHRGRGVAASLVARAVADFRAAGRKVIPACWFARQQFRENPDWADLLFQAERSER
jgi:predicted GNAT family acetyltransferase